MIIYIIIILAIILLMYINARSSVFVVEEIPNFLTPVECDLIVELSKNRLSNSFVYSENSDDYVTKYRISEQCWLNNEVDPLIKKISDLVAKRTGTSISDQEELQVVRYKPGGYFRPHYDACDGNKQFCKRMNDGKGPRLLTVLVYLNDDYSGGETIFPNLKKTIQPEKGKAILFYSIDHRGDILRDSLHGGDPVKSGEKWIANKWVRLPDIF